MGVRAVVLTAGSLVCLLAVAVQGCALDRTPEPWGDRRSQVTSAPERTVDAVPTDGVFGSSPEPTGPDPSVQVGGLQCGGIFCPFTQEPIQPCCTSVQDVERGSARETERCGLDFSETSGDFFGDACWQRDQLGVPDSNCPGVPLQPGLEESGCCTDQGLCGGMNSGQAIGCHYALDQDPQPCGAAEVDQAVTCEPLGVFGVRTTVDVAWGGRSGGLVGLTDDGRARLVIHLMVRLERLNADNSVTGTVRPCGVDLPPFYSTTLCESYKPIFPERIWESVAVPEYPLSGRYQCLHPGCILTLDALTALLGISLENPESPWPTPQQTPTVACPGGTGMSCFPDVDDDDLPGLTIELRHAGSATLPGTSCTNGFAYRGAPLSASPAAIFGGVRRTDRMFLGTRTKLGGSGKIADDCNSGVGAGIAEFVQSRAWGCFVQEGTFNFGATGPAGPDEFCQAPEAAFVDENLPIYQILGLGQTPDPVLKVDQAPSEGALFSLARLGGLGDRVGCTDVRNAPYR